ncbi:MAG: alkaline phosphatase family protein [Candidatus Magnetoovum sp. WYHC-5]|nr:alkaline phosphatase family protein [Candidatus Magnetoovum sp. WYHC-5]
MNLGKIIIIAIDGATFDIILPMLEKGELPNFSKIMSGGVWGRMMSTYPPHTIPAWPVCASGKNPGKLGLFDFRANSHTSYDEGAVLTSRDIKTKLIWNILSERNKTVMVTAMPLTYPPVKVNGVMVSPVRLIEPDKLKTYPEGLFAELVKEIDLGSVLRQRRQFMEMHTSRIEGSLEAFLDTTINTSNLIIEKLTDIVIYLHSKNRYDFSMFMLPIDALQHHLWCFMDHGHPSYEPTLAKKYKNAVFDGYKSVDNALGRIFKALDDGNTTFFLVSDHGFGPLHHIFYANKWLMDNGFLKLKKGLQFTIKKKEVTISRVFEKLGSDFIADKLPKSIKIKTLPFLFKEVKPNSELIDWQNTKAYATSYAININLKGREPLGIVTTGNGYKRVVEELKSALYSQKDISGKQLIDKVLEKHELYSGPYVDEAPDLAIFFKNPRYSIRKDCLYPEIFRTLNTKDRLTGHHTSFPKGICIIKGPNIIPNGPINDPKIEDITPTALYLLNEPIPQDPVTQDPITQDIDGRILTEAITHEYTNSTPARFTNQQNGIIEYVEGEDFNEIDKNAVEEHLKQLGYLG